MKFPIKLKRIFGAVPLGVLLSSVAAMTQAAPGVLSKQPLFIGASTQPNIMFLVDDSGSMGWNYVWNKGAWHVGGNNALRRCVGFNVMAFDPNRAANYVPWAGKDSLGDTYTNRALNNASDDPYWANYTRQLHSYTYVPWNDNDGDGEYDHGECDTANPVRADSLPANLQQAYANWYTYYRIREYVAKRALSQIIHESTARVGLATLHDHNNVGTEIKNIDNQSTSNDKAQNQINKDFLMQELFRIHSSSGTPLRSRLRGIGQYYDTNASPPSYLFDNGSADSPILPLNQNGECQQNFAVVMSDGYWNSDSGLNVGNHDGDNNSNFDGGTYGDTFSNTLADIAMYYYETDLATDLPDNVKTLPGVDENRAQHLVTYTVAFGINGAVENMPPDWSDAQKAAGWPQPVSNQLSTVDDMRHAAYNGRGEFLNANDPQTLIDSLNAAIRSINNRQGSASAVAFSSTSLSTDTKIFQGVFDSRGWYGDLASFNLSNNQLGSVNWRAGQLLESRNLSTNQRQIATFNGSRGVTFKFPNTYWKYFKPNNPTTLDLSADVLNEQQMRDLIVGAPFDFVVPWNTAGGTQDGNTDRLQNQAYAESLVNYLKGDHSNEGLATNNFRDRFGHRLGDIVNSSPKFVGAPSNSYPDKIGSNTDLYSSFVSAKQNRTAMVYVGANDGMLHAFNATTGQEKFAYIPGLVFSDEANEGLHFLADKQYTHTPYVDGTPAVQDVYIDGAWRTYLVGGLRAGGKGVYVLDVTNPDNNSAATANSWVKFEYTDNNLGYTFSDPQIVKLNNGKWAAIMGNGYNNDPTGDGKAKLYMVYLDGSGAKVIDTGSGSVKELDCNDQVSDCNGLPKPRDLSSGAVKYTDCAHVDSDCNGLSTPIAIDITGDYVPDRVYAGDLHGNMWAFDISSGNDNHWGIAHSDGSSAKPLFTACSTNPCTNASRQPITAKPTVKVHHQRRLASHAPSLIVYFGTGQFMANADSSNSSAQTVYAVWDSGTPSLNRSNLKQQTISAITNGRNLTQYTPAYNETTKTGMGWYINLPDSRERSVTSPVLFGSLLLFNTIVPDAASCDGGGYGYFMAVDALTGGKPKFKVLDFNNDGNLDDGAGQKLTSMGGEIAVIGKNAVFNQSDATLKILQIADKEELGKRTSWTILR